MYIDDDWNNFKIWFVLFIICIAAAFFFSGCKSFEAVQIPGQTPECNDFYTVLQYYSVQGKDSAFIGTVYNECKNSRQDAKQKKIEELCGQIYTDKNEYAKCLK